MTPRPVVALTIHPLPDDPPVASTWQLAVDGLADPPRRFRLRDLIGLAPRSSSADFACEAGWVVPGLRWGGVSVAALLERARLRPEVRWPRVGAGDFTVAQPLPVVVACALLAYRLDREWLPTEHGSRLRLVAPGGACFFSVKWVDRLELRADPGETTGETIACIRVGDGDPQFVARDDGAR